MKNLLNSKRNGFEKSEKFLFECVMFKMKKKNRNVRFNICFILFVTKTLNSKRCFK